MARLEVQRIEVARVLAAYRRTGAAVMQECWAEVGDDGLCAACGLGVVLLDTGSTVEELGHMDYRVAAEVLGLSRSYVCGFATGFDGRADIDATDPDLRLFCDLEGWEGEAERLAIVEELRRGIADGADAYRAVELAESRGELHRDGGHYVDAATRTGMYDHD
jgi:hypothetical protein